MHIYASARVARLFFAHICVTDSKVNENIRTDRKMKLPFVDPSPFSYMKIYINFLYYRMV